MPSHVHAFTTTRDGGISLPPYDSFNLATHVGDNTNAVMENRARLRQQLPSEPVWLNQTHSIIAANLDHWQPSDGVIDADASFTTQQNRVCVAMTADCLPLLVCNQDGTEVAAIHAGWRGLLAGVIENTITQLQSPAETLSVWLGPAIGAEAFEVDNQIRLDFLARYPQNSIAFKQVEDHYLADIYALARHCLSLLGVKHIFGGDYCTVSDEKKFFSYRRNQKTGRMASLIWFEAH